jgi:hypothetical protein
MAKKKVTPWDKWSFNAAWIIALILALGLAFTQTWAQADIWTLILVILGIVTGFTYLSKDILPLVLVALALVTFTGSSLSIVPYIGVFLNDLIGIFLSYLTPAALIVALRKVYNMFQ